ncbi:MAG: hypothetical protein ABJP48_00415 [Erythrobacter sp.]
MTDKMRDWLALRGPSMIALVLPCIAGLAYLTWFGAPSSFIIINAGTLALGLLWIALAPQSPVLSSRVLAVFLLALMALPLFTGPHLNGVARWIPFGPFSLHSGMAIVPLLVCIAAANRDYAPPILLGGVFITLIQPDAASAFALMLASVGLYFAWRDWKPGVVAIIAFIAGLLAAVRGELPAQPYVEHVIANLMLESPFAALGLLAIVVASFFAMLFITSQPAVIRFALAGSFAGFTFTALITNYPTPLIGFGPAPILGYALALGAMLVPSSNNKS